MIQQVGGCVNGGRTVNSESLRAKGNPCSETLQGLLLVFFVFVLGFLFVAAYHCHNCQYGCYTNADGEVLEEYSGHISTNFHEAK